MLSFKLRSSTRRSKVGCSWPSPAMIMRRVGHSFTASAIPLMTVPMPLYVENRRDAKVTN